MADNSDALLEVEPLVHLPGLLAQLLPEARPRHALEVDEDEAVHPGGVGQPQPQQDAGTRAVPEADHLDGLLNVAAEIRRRRRRISLELCHV